MSKIGVSLKIDVSKIDKARLFKGEKGTYLDATAFIDLSNFDKYGKSGMVTQDVTKEERSQDIKGPILGNSRIFFVDGIDMPVDASGPPPAAPQPSPEIVEDDIPFS